MVSDLMGKSITLANMLDERRANLAQRQRQQNIRDIFKQPGTFDVNSGFSPEAIGQVAGQDVDEAVKLGMSIQMMSYKQAMANQAAAHSNLFGVQADTLPGYRQSQIDKNDAAAQKAQNDMLMQKHKNALNIQASLLYNNGKDFDADSYDNTKHFLRVT